MSIVVSREKMNNSCQIGSSGTIIKEERDISFSWTGTVGTLAVTTVSITFSPAMPSIPILFGNVSDQVSGAAAQAIIISFGSVSTSSALMYIYNTSNVTNVGNGFLVTISIRAISL